MKRHDNFNSFGIADNKTNVYLACPLGNHLNRHTDNLTDIKGPGKDLRRSLNISYNGNYGLAGFYLHTGNL